MIEDQKEPIKSNSVAQTYDKQPTKFKRFVAQGVCPECNRIFDFTNETDAEEWSYGHDCEAT